jgi:hypothetical protein
MELITLLFASNPITIAIELQPTTISDEAISLNKSASPPILILIEFFFIAQLYLLVSSEG